MGKTPTWVGQCLEDSKVVSLITQTLINKMAIGQASTIQMSSINWRCHQINDLIALIDLLDHNDLHDLHVLNVHNVSPDLQGDHL